MRAVVQRVSAARVTVAGKCCGAIGRGLVVLLGVARGDTSQEADWLAGKIARLRIFDDRNGAMNLSVCQCGGEVLVVSQFTLLADCRRGNRPGFRDAADPDDARRHILFFQQALRRHGLTVETGLFGAHMLVRLENDGPVTVILERSASG